MAYSFDLIELYERVANTIGAILRGAKPGDIPIYQVTKFELSINLKTAKQLGLSVPLELLASADKVTGGVLTPRNYARNHSAGALTAPDASRFGMCRNSAHTSAETKQSRANP